jgi:hypothetical protein
MTIGASMFCITVGAILHFAVTAELAGIEIQTVGTILMIVGGFGLLLAVAFLVSGRRRAVPPGPPPY